MKITAKVLGYRPSISMDPALMGFSTRKAKNALIVELFELSPSETEKKKIIKVPRILKKSFIVIDIAEEGGAQFGSGTIICDMEGSKLLPYYIFKNKNGQNAFFSSQKNIISITGNYRTSDVLIQKFEINDAKNTDTIILRCPILFSGSLNLLPLRFNRYRLAASVAVLKSNCQNCHDVHFALVKAK